MVYFRVNFYFEETWVEMTKKMNNYITSNKGYTYQTSNSLHRYEEWILFKEKLGFIV